MGTDLRIGMVGLGAWGSRLAEAVQRTPGTSLTTCFARSDARRATFAERFRCVPVPRLEDLLEGDVDAVVVAAAHSSHPELIQTAAKAGKHVFVEKPLALSVTSARAAIAAADEAGIVLQVGHQRRRLAATRELRRLIDADELGVPHLFQATITSPGVVTPEGSWRTRPEERPLGGMTGLGIHMIDNLQYLAGRARRVSTFSRPVLDDGPIDEVTGFLIEYDHAIAQLSNATISPRVATVTVYGTRGCAWSEEDGIRLFRQDLGETARHEIPLEPVDALVEEFTEFAACVRSGARPEVDGAAGLEVVAVLEAGKCSAERGAAVDVDEVRLG